MQRQTYALATILWGRYTDSTHIETLAEAIKDLFADFSDERLIDLYSLLEEKISSKPATFLQLVMEVDQCLEENENFWTNRVI